MNAGRMTKLPATIAPTLAFGYGWDIILASDTSDNSDGARCNETASLDRRRVGVPWLVFRQYADYASPYNAAALSCVSFRRISGVRSRICRSIAAREFGHTLSGWG
jgi:hypothetical protein